MRLLNDGVLYDFTVEQGGSTNADHGGHVSHSNSNSSLLLRTAMQYRKFQHPNRRPVAVREQSLDLYLNTAQARMSQILVQYEVPSRVGEQMAEHFGFMADRLARRNINRSEIRLSVRLEVKLLPPETDGEIRGNMESARTVAPRRRREEPEVQTVPTRRSSIEALERVRVGELRECAVCLEGMVAGMEASRMPCGHLYHWNCIVGWLQRTHFCPLCRYKMPCA